MGASWFGRPLLTGHAALLNQRGTRTTG